MLACTAILGMAKRLEVPAPLPREGPGAIELPTRDALAQAPLIVVSASGEIMYQGQLIGSSEVTLADSADRVDALFERLDAATKKIRGWPDECDDGAIVRVGRFDACRIVILSAAPTTDARLVYKVVKTVEAVGFDVLFAMPET